MIDDAAFEVFRPETLQAIEHWTYQFVEATNNTSTLRLDLAIEELRYSLGSGLQAGETTQQLAKRVGEIFADPFRAFRISTTEVSRAMHSGAYEAARESGEVHGMRWLASSDACEEICLPLAGKIVEFEEPFWVNPKGKEPYRTVFHPPAHPHCMCDCVPVL